MAIQFFNEIEWYDREGNKVESGLVRKAVSDGIKVDYSKDSLADNDNIGGFYDNLMYHGEKLQSVPIGSLLLGWNNKIEHRHSIITGACNESTDNFQIVMGKYNDENKIGYLIIGTGDGENNRRTGFYVQPQNDGRGIVNIDGVLKLHNDANSNNCAKIKYENNSIKFIFGED